MGAHAHTTIEAANQGKRYIPYRPENPSRGPLVEPPTDPLYIVIVEGDCMKPVLNDGEMAVIENRLPDPGEVGVIFFNDGQQPLVKRIETLILNSTHHPESEVTQLVYFSQINPERLYSLSADRISGYHTVTGTLDPDGVLHPLNPTWGQADGCE